MVNLKKYKGGYKKANLTLPAVLVEKLDEVAKEAGMSRSEFVAWELAKRLEINIYDFGNDEGMKRSADTMMAFLGSESGIEKPKRKKAREKKHEKRGRPKKAN